MSSVETLGCRVWSATVFSASSTPTPAPMSVASCRVTRVSARAPIPLPRGRTLPGFAAVGSTETGMSWRVRRA